MCDKHAPGGDQTMRPLTKRIVHRSADALPRAAVDELFRQWMGQQHVALCLHRVHQGPRRPGEFSPVLSISADELDTLIERALLTRPEARDRWLTVSFDDGYEDAARYVRVRARRYPQVDWLFFVCPEKVEKQAGFRWDLLENAGPDQQDAVMTAPVDLSGENERPELRALPRRPEFRLADLELCRELARLPNVRLGNHTNVHQNPLRMTDEQAAEEYGRAHRDYVRLFGPQEHFAFPFGTPENEFSGRHVAMLRRLSDGELWSTEGRPFSPEERGPGAVIPRFPVDGRRTAHQVLFWMAVSAMNHQVRGTPYSYPKPPRPLSAVAA